MLARPYVPSSALAMTQATPFVSRASLVTAPEDILVQILALLSVLDVLALRRTCKRLNHITHARIVWVASLRAQYARRRILAPTSTHISTVPTKIIEEMALRPLRFQHALADINNAFHYRQSSNIEDDTEVIPHTRTEDEEKSGVLAVYLVPGGRWLYCVANFRTSNLTINYPHPSVKSFRAVVMVWDLLTRKHRIKHFLARSAHWASIQLDETGNVVTIVVGVEKTHSDDPFFQVFQMNLPPLCEDPFYFSPTVGVSAQSKIPCTRIFKTSRTPRACCVFGNIVAFGDRSSIITFWDFINNSVSKISVNGWPPIKGAKIMIISPQLVALFNRASTTFSIYKIPPLQPLTNPAPQTDIPVDSSLFSSAPVVPSIPIKRFRLPARYLSLVLPKLNGRTTAPAPENPDDLDPIEDLSASCSSSRDPNEVDPMLLQNEHGPGDGASDTIAQIPRRVRNNNQHIPHTSNSLVAAYFLLFHSEMPGDLYLGLIPEITSFDPEEEDDILALVHVDSSSDEDDGDGPGGSQPIGAHADTPDPPAGPGTGTGHPHPSAAATAAAALNNPDEPAWLETIRCHDSTVQPTSYFPLYESPDFVPTHDSISFDGNSRILYVGSFMDSTRIIVVRSSDEGYIEVFTTDSVHQRNWEALHAMRPIQSLNGAVAPLAEGDYQILSYQVSGQAWAASVDDLSGKIVLVVQEEGRYFIVVLDYGFPSTTERSGDKAVTTSDPDSHLNVGRRATSDSSQDEDQEAAPRLASDKGKGKELNSPRHSGLIGSSHSRKGKGKARQLSETREDAGLESDIEDHEIDGGFVQTELELEAGFDRTGSSSTGVSRTVLTISNPSLPHLSGSYLGHLPPRSRRSAQAPSPSEHRH